MARVTSVDLDYQAIGELLRTPEMEAEMVRRMTKVMDLAVSSAPVGDDDDQHRGRYRESFHLTHGLAGMPGAIKLDDRAWAMLENDAPEALYVEYGNRNTPRRHTMLNALTAGAID